MLQPPLPEALQYIAVVTEDGEGRADVIALLGQICATRVQRLGDALDFSSGQPLCAVVDIDLAAPVSGARQAWLRALSERHGLPLIFVLDPARQQHFKQSLERAKRCGATNFLLRPLDPHDIYRIIPDAYGFRFERDALAQGGASGSGVAAAHRALTAAFSSARTDRRLDAAEIAQYEDPILDALRSGGIRRWLDLVRGHHSRTFTHSLLVTGVAVAFAQHLTMRYEDQRRIARAGLLHDIGKAFVPLAILDKPDKLTPREMEIVKQHPVSGHAMLAGQRGFADEVLDCVRHHHEFLDGSGYPDGLAGGEIADLVRIITIADIFSALIEKRSYKPPLPQAKAREIMEGMEDKLDRHLLRAFWPVLSNQFD